MLKSAQTFTMIGGLGLIVSGCAPKIGVNYQCAVKKTKAQLEQGASRVPSELFRLEIEEKGDQTTFRFTAGDRRNKAAHAFPVRVRVELQARAGGEDATLKVSVWREELWGSWPSRARKRCWQEKLWGALQGERHGATSGCSGRRRGNALGPALFEPD